MQIIHLYSLSILHLIQDVSGNQWDSEGAKSLFYCRDFVLKCAHDVRHDDKIVNQTQVGNYLMNSKKN